MHNIFLRPDKETNYQSYMVFVLTIIWSVVSVIVIFIGFSYFPELWLQWMISLGSAFLIATINLTLNHCGYTRTASWSLTIMLWLYIIIPCYSSGGVFAPGILSQMSVILTAGFLLGRRAGLAIGLLTIVADFGLACLEMKGYLPAPAVIHDPISRWISAIVPFGTILVLQYYAIDYHGYRYVSINPDITQKKEALEKLRTSEERYKSIIKVSNTGAWEYDMDTRRVWFSAQYFAMLGLDRPDGIWEDADNMSWINRLHPDDREQSVKMFDDFLAENSRELYENFFRMRHQNGDWVWIWSRARRLRDKNGDLTHISLGTHTDISERIKAEEKIKESEQLIKKITSHVPGNTYMFEIEESGKPNILFVNRGNEEFNFTTDLEDLSSNSEIILEVWHDDDRALFNEKMKEAYQSETPLSIQYRIVVNDVIRWRWLQAVPEKNKNGKVIWYGSTRDITPLVDYIVSIEQIIFDITHVIRRPIASMMGITSLISLGGYNNDEIKEFSEKLHLIAGEMDNFVLELNRVYHEKRHDTTLNIDISSLIDKRKSLFSSYKIP